MSSRVCASILRSPRALIAKWSAWSLIETCSFIGSQPKKTMICIQRGMGKLHRRASRIFREAIEIEQVLIGCCSVGYHFFSDRCIQDGLSKPHSDTTRRPELERLRTVSNESLAFFEASFFLCSSNGGQAASRQFSLSKLLIRGIILSASERLPAVSSMWQNGGHQRFD